LIGGVNAAGYLACSLPRGATPAFHVVCSPATTLALAPQQRFFSFALYVRPISNTHTHTVFLITSTIVTINQTVRCFAVFYSDRHDRVSLCFRR
jgi:hypothetical protein